MPLIMLVQEPVTLDFHSANLEFWELPDPGWRHRDKRHYGEIMLSIFITILYFFGTYMK